MIKHEIIAAFAEETKRTKIESEKILNDIVEFVSTKIIAGETLKLVGFMELGVKLRKERNSVNPKTGEKIRLQAVNIPYVKFSKNLKDGVK